MTPKIKKIIAKEGLAILAILFIATTCFIFVYLRNDLTLPPMQNIEWHQAYPAGELYRNWIVLIATPYYAIHIISLLIRFIKWAIRTLKGR